MRRPLRVIGAAALALVALLFTARLVLSAPRPDATASAEGDALALRMAAAVNQQAWEGTGAVRWTFAGKNQHLWDRARGLDRVTWGDTVVLVDLSKQQGRVTRDGQPLTGSKADRLVAKAYAAWINDSFWLNPVVKAMDGGTTRAVVTPTDEDAGRTGLLVSYSSGGLTPGDAYLWLLDENDRPVAWRMWVSVIPVGGLRATWEGWTTLSTGAMVSTRHAMGPVDLELTDVAGAATLAELEPGPDPFAPLMGP